MEQIGKLKEPRTRANDAFVFFSRDEYEHLFPETPPSFFDKKENREKIGIGFKRCETGIIVEVINNGGYVGSLHQVILKVRKDKDKPSSFAVSSRPIARELKDQYSGNVKLDNGRILLTTE